MYTPNMKPLCFWPYTSVVLERILEIQYTNGDRIDRFKQECLAWFQAAGIPCQDDNKIVFEFYDSVSERQIYFGFYDLRMSIGHNFHTDVLNNTRTRIEARKLLLIEYQNTDW